MSSISSVDENRPVAWKAGMSCLFLLALICVAAGLPARAAEGYDNCTGIITSLPASITTSGTWCLQQDASTAITSGSAIDVQTDNVTLDCNDFTLNGLAAGSGSTARGIAGTHRSNVIIRNCRVTGFHFGIALVGNGGGHLIEDNLLVANLHRGIYVAGIGNRVQRNRVHDTGGATGNAYSYGIYAAADIIENTVAGVYSSQANSYPYAVLLFGTGNSAERNRIRSLLATGTGYASGIHVAGDDNLVHGNHIGSDTATTGYGINGNGNLNTFCGNNSIGSFSNPIVECQDAGGNISN